MFLSMNGLVLLKVTNIILVVQGFVKNSIGLSRGTSCKVANLTKIADLTKHCESDQKHEKPAKIYLANIQIGWLNFQDGDFTTMKNLPKRANLAKMANWQKCARGLENIQMRWQKGTLRKWRNGEMHDADEMLRRALYNYVEGIKMAWYWPFFLFSSTVYGYENHQVLGCSSFDLKSLEYVAPRVKTVGEYPWSSH